MEGNKRGLKGREWGGFDKTCYIHVLKSQAIRKNKWGVLCIRVEGKKLRVSQE